MTGIDLYSKPPHPMLARTGSQAVLKGAIEQGYIIEPKIDGIRCLAVVGRGGESAQLYNRQLRNITAAFPEVVQSLRTHVGTWFGPVVLDGEVAVYGKHGQADFQLVQHRANRIKDVATAAQAFPATYVAFDVLQSGSVNYTGLHGYSMEQRRGILTEIAPVHTISNYTQATADMLANNMIGEGLMLKHKSSKYYPGVRSPAWIKVKWLREVECFVGGLTWGYGKREGTFGGLLVGVPLPEDVGNKRRLTYIGTVGTGFNDEALEALTLQLTQLRTNINPFVQERGQDWDTQFFVDPLVQIKVQFAEYTRTGIMRFPRYAGMAG